MIVVLAIYRYHSKVYHEMNSVYEYQLFYQQPKDLNRTSNVETTAYVKNNVGKDRQVFEVNLKAIGFT